MNDLLQARVSPQGFNFLNAHSQQLVELFAPGQTLMVPIECSVQATTGLVIADMGSAGCLTETCGLMDGKCTAADVPAQVPVTITGLSLAPLPPSSVKATVQVQIATGKLYVDSTSRSHVACLFSSPVKCGMDFSSTRAVPLSNTIGAELELVADPAFSQRLSVKLASVDGLAACGTSGALPPPSCTDNNDLLITPEAGGCCPGGTSGLVKDALLGFIANELQVRLEEALNAAACEPCGPGNSCAMIEEDGGSGTCDVGTGLCVNAFAGRCVPNRIGVEGRMNPAALIDPNTPSTSELDLSLAVAHSVSANTGLDLGSRGGTQAVQVADCVPAATPPPAETIPAVNFDGESDGGYHLGLALGRPFLDRAGYDLQQSGALCASLDRSTIDALTTGVLRPFLPSLDVLIGPDDVPMRVVIAPQAPPTFAIGSGTFDPATHAVVDPLLRLNAKDVRIDVYAQLEDRYVRLFSALVDLSLPASLIPAGCGRLLPVLGDLQDVVSNPRFTNSELVAEDVSALGPLLPAVVTMAEPQISSALSAFTLPTLSSFALEVNQVKGVHPSTAAGTFDAIGIYATMVDASQCVPPTPVPISLTLTKVETPDGTELRQGHWPVARFAVEGDDLEIAFRWDDGMWSTFAQVDREVLVSAPALLLQGRHRVELRARHAGEQSSTVLPATVITVDLQAPRISMVREGDSVRAVARDSVTTTEKLRYAFRLGNGAWSEPGAPRSWSVVEIDAAGGLEAKVVDEAGLEATARYGATEVLDHQESTDDGTNVDSCSAGVGLLPALSLVVLGALRRRRRRD